MKFSRYKSADVLSASGDGGIRTLDPLLARQVLSQLSYTPTGARGKLVYYINMLCSSVS